MLLYWPWQPVDCNRCVTGALALSVDRTGHCNRHWTMQNERPYCYESAPECSIGWEPVVDRRSRPLVGRRLRCCRRRRVVRLVGVEDGFGGAWLAR